MTLSWDLLIPSGRLLDPTGGILPDLQQLAG